MRPTISRLTLVKIAVLFGAWTAYGVLCAWQAHYWYSVSKTPMSWADSFRFELTYAYLWGACTPLVAWFARCYRFERGVWARHPLIHVVVVAILVPVIKIAFDLIAMPLTSPF